METSTLNLPTKPRHVNPVLGRELCAVEIEDLKTGEITRTTNPVNSARARAKAKELRSVKVFACVIYLGYEGEIKPPTPCGTAWPEPKEAA